MENENMVQEQTGAEEKAVKDKKKNSILPVIVIIALVAIAGIYLYKQQADAPVMSIDGVEFKLKDKASVLTDAGFEISGKVSKLPAKTWEMLFEVEKDGVLYAYVTLYNTSSSEKELSECNIGEVTVMKQSYMAYDKFMVNGVNVFEVSADEARTELGIKEDDTVVSTDLGYAHVRLSDYDTTADTYGEVYIYCDFGKKYD